MVRAVFRNDWIGVASNGIAVVGRAIEAVGEVAGCIGFRPDTRCILVGVGGVAALFRAVDGTVG